MNSGYIDLLLEYQDKKYGDFQAKLTPNVPRDQFIGVRVPNIRKIAKDCVKNGSYEAFVNELPHKFFEENMLHACILSEIKDYECALERVDAFLPYVDNWAVCDSIIPKVFKKHKEELVGEIKRWMASEEDYEYRFGVKMLMTFFLDGDFKPEYLEWVVGKESNEYYVNMMRAWYYATALAKQWDDTVKVIESNRLDVWTHNKSIQKARESFRVSDDHKAYLNTLKRKK